MGAGSGLCLSDPKPVTPPTATDSQGPSSSSIVSIVFHTGTFYEETGLERWVLLVTPVRKSPYLLPRNGTPYFPPWILVAAGQDAV